MKKRQSKSLLILSFLTTLLASCQVTITETIQIKQITIELANYHVKDNKFNYYSSYTPDYNSEYSVSYQIKNNNTSDTGINGCGYLSWSPNIDETNDGGANTPQLKDTNYKNYRWLKAELTDMEGLSLDYVSGYMFMGMSDFWGQDPIAYNSNVSKIDTDRTDNILTTRAYVYPSEDEFNNTYWYKTLCLYGIGQAEEEYNKKDGISFRESFWNNILGNSWLNQTFGDKRAPIQHSSFPVKNKISDKESKLYTSIEDYNWKTNNGDDTKGGFVNLKSYFSKYLDNFNTYIQKYINEIGEATSSYKSGSSYMFKDDSYFDELRGEPAYSETNETYNVLTNSFLGHSFNRNENTGNGGGLIKEDDKQSQKDREDLNNKLDALSNELNATILYKLQNNGCITTTELRSELTNIIEQLFNYYLLKIERGYNEAISYWDNEWCETRDEYYSTYSKISSLKEYINKAYCRLGDEDKLLSKSEQPFPERTYDYGYSRDIYEEEEYVKDEYLSNLFDETVLTPVRLANKTKTQKKVYTIKKEKEYYENNIKILKEERDDWQKIVDEFKSNITYLNAKSNSDTADTAYESNQTAIQAIKDEIAEEEGKKDTAWSTYKANCKAEDKKVSDQQEIVEKWYAEENNEARQQREAAEEKLESIKKEVEENKNTHYANYLTTIDDINNNIDDLNEELEDAEKEATILYDDKVTKNEILEGYETQLEAAEKEVSDRDTLIASNNAYLEQLKNEYKRYLNGDNSYNSIENSYTKLSALYSKIGWDCDWSFGTKTRTVNCTDAKGRIYFKGGNTYNKYKHLINEDGEEYYNSEYKNTILERLEITRYWYNTWVERKKKFENLFNFSQLLEDFKTAWNSYNTTFRVEQKENAGVGYLKKNFLTGDIIEPLDGFNEPDVWEFGSTDYNLSTCILPGSYTSINDEIARYESKNARERGKNDWWIIKGVDTHLRDDDGQTAYFIPLSIENNMTTNRNNEDSILNEGLNTFSHEFNNFKLLISFDMSHVYDKDGNSLTGNKWYSISIGNMHLIPTNETYHKDLDAGRYESWEIKNMELALEKIKKDENNEEGED